MRKFMPFILLITCQITFAQSDEIQRMTNKLSSLNGIQKAEKINEICAYYYQQNWDSVAFYAHQMLEVSTSHQYNQGMAEAYNYLGFAKQASSEFDQSKIYFHRALTISTDSPMPRIASYEGLGKLYLNTNRLDSASYYYDLAIEQADNLQQPKKVKKLDLMKGLIANEKGLYKDAIRILLKDYDYFVALNDVEALHDIYNGVGNAYFQLYDLENAKKYYQKALEKSLHLENPIDIGKSYGNLANMYGNLEKFDSSALFFKKSYNYFKQAGDLGRANLVRINLLNLYALTGQNHELLALSKSLEKEQLSPENRIILLHSKSRGLYALGQTKKAMEALEEAIHIAKDLDSNQSLLKLYTTGVKQYLATNDTTILSYYKQYDIMLNERFDRDNKEIMNDLTIKYELKEKEAELTKSKLTNERNKRYIFATVGASFLILLLAGGSLRYNKQRLATKALEKEMELRDLQKQMARLGLSNINNQIDSHDFKNMMTAVLTEIQEKAPASYQRLVNLLQITETALYNDAFTDTLSNQLKQITAIVDIANQQLFEEIELEIDNEIKEEIEIPRLLLKNLVENAIKHGIQGTGKPGRIQLLAKKMNDVYEIIIADNGRGFQEGMHLGKGITIYQDLFKHFNEKNTEKAELTFASTTNGISAKVRIPVNYQYH